MISELYIDVRNEKYLIVVDKDYKYKDVSIEFVDDHFVVNAPTKTTDASVKYYVNINAKKLAPELFKRKYVYIFGKRYSVDNIVIDGKKIDGSSEEKLTEQLESILLEYGKKSFAYHADRMGMKEPYKLFVDYKDKHLAYNDLYNKEMALSFNLIHFSKEIIDAVIIHEITHCFVREHSKEFYDIYAKYCPNYRDAEYKFTHGKYR